MRVLKHTIYFVFKIKRRASFSPSTQVCKQACLNTHKQNYSRIPCSRGRHTRPLRTGLRILSGGISTGGTTLAGSVDNACSVRCDKLPRNTGRPVGASLRIHSGGISTGGTTLAGSVDNACSVRYDKLPQSTGRPGCTHCIRRQSSLTYSYAISVRSCAAGRIRARHPVIGIVRPVGTGTGEGRHGARGGGTCFARQGPVRGGPTVRGSVIVV